MAHFAKFVSLARTPDEIKEQQAKDAGRPPDKIPEPVYPYGLCIYLDDEILKKLDIDHDGCEVGDTIHLCCMAEVTDVSQRKMSDGVKCRIELQITQMAVENEDAEGAGAFDNSERMKKRYGINAEAGEDE